MPPDRPMKMPKSVMDLIWPDHLVAAIEAFRELAPRVRLALLEAERDAAALLVDVEDHDLDFLADVHDLGGIDVLVGPIHLGDVDEAFDALLDLHEAAVVGDIRDLAEERVFCG